jgi:DNA gyrase subunit A
VPAREYKAQRRGGKGVIGMATKDEDGLSNLLACSSLDYLLFFTDKGKVYSEKAYGIPETGRANRGILVHSILNIAPDETITAIKPVSDFEIPDAYFILATRQGRIKRVYLEDFKDVRPSGLIAMSLNDGDSVGWVEYSNGEQDVILATKNAQSIRFPENDVRVMGRPAGGVNAIRLSDNDLVAGMDVINLEEDTHLLVVTKNGFGKRSDIHEYVSQARFGIGARTLHRNEKTGDVVAIRAINPSDGILLITRYGIVLRTHLTSIRETKRDTQGVRLINLQKGDEIVGIAIIQDEGEDEILEGEEGVEGEILDAVNVIPAEENGAEENNEIEADEDDSYGNDDADEDEDDSYGSDEVDEEEDEE